MARSEDMENRTPVGATKWTYKCVFGDVLIFVLPTKSLETMRKRASELFEHPQGQPHGPSNIPEGPLRGPTNICVFGDVSIFVLPTKLLETITKRRRTVLCFAHGVGASVMVAVCTVEGRITPFYRATSQERCFALRILCRIDTKTVATLAD